MRKSIHNGVRHNHWPLNHKSKHTRMPMNLLQSSNWQHWTWYYFLIKSHFWLSLQITLLLWKQLSFNLMILITCILYLRKWIKRLLQHEYGQTQVLQETKKALNYYALSKTLPQMFVAKNKIHRQASLIIQKFFLLIQRQVCPLKAKKNIVIKWMCIS